jgi:hypothetical protein
MIVIRQKRIYREDLGTNDKVALYLFGDNLMHEGMGGQAAEMRHEPNAVGVPTKKAPFNDASSFFSDADFDDVDAVYAGIFSEIKEKFEDGKFKVLVLPADGLGTGLAALDKKAPKIFALLQEYLCELEQHA